MSNFTTKESAALLILFIRWIEGSPERIKSISQLRRDLEVGEVGSLDLIDALLRRLASPSLEAKNIGSIYLTTATPKQLGREVELRLAEQQNAYENLQRLRDHEAKLYQDRITELEAISRVKPKTKG